MNTYNQLISKIHKTKGGIKRRVKNLKALEKIKFDLEIELGIERERLNKQPSSTTSGIEEKLYSKEPVNIDNHLSYESYEYETIYQQTTVVFTAALGYHAQRFSYARLANCKVYLARHVTVHTLRVG